MKTQRRKIKFDLFENGLDFIVNSLQSILVKKDDTDFKYAILHIADGAELILKSILKNEDWNLLFEDVDKANLDDLKSGNFSSVKFETSIRRLENECGIILDSEEKRFLKELRKRRNKIQHFEFNEEKESISSLVAKILVILLSLIHENINIDEYSEEAKRLYKLMSEKSSEFEEATDLILAKQQKRIDEEKEAGRLILFYPNCYQETLVIGGEGRECLFCRFNKEPETLAYLYIENIIGLSEYQEIKDGGYFPLVDCPMCNRSSLVVNDEAICFYCGENWERNELENCTECNRFFPIENLKLQMFEECYSNRQEKFGEYLKSASKNS